MGRTQSLTYQGETRSQAGWAAHLGLDLRTLNFRLTHGWTVEKTLSTPANAHRSRICRWCPVHELAWLPTEQGSGHWHPLSRSVLAEALRWAQMGGCAAQIQVREVPCSACAPVLEQQVS
jgi:hypothetical protein